MLVDLDDTGLQPGQVPRADGVVDADEVADAKRGKSGGRANGVEEPAACVDSLGERGELIVVVACGDGTQQGRLASDYGQAPMPRGSLPHDPEHGQPAGPIGDAGPSPSSPGPIDLGSSRDGEAFRADRVRDLPYHRGGVVVRRGQSAPRTSIGSRTTSWSASHRAQKILVILHGVTARASCKDWIATNPYEEAETVDCQALGRLDQSEAWSRASVTSRGSVSPMIDPWAAGRRIAGNAKGPR